MPLGIVSDDDFEVEKNKLGIGIESNGQSIAQENDSSEFDGKDESFIEGTIQEIQRGRGEGSIEVPSQLRALIGISAVEDGNGSARALARTFDVSDSSLSAYKRGATSTASYNEPNEELINKVNQTRLKISKRAQHRLISALQHITPEKLKDAKLRDVAATAQAMSAIIRNIEPQVESKGNGNNVSFVFFTPKFRPESEYDVITVDE